MGRAGQAFQVDYAASGGQANTAAVQREIAPRVFAPDNAQLSPEGSILSPGAPPRSAIATQQPPNPRVFAPDGAQLSPEGSILSLPGQTPAPPAPPPPPPPPPQAERGNNPTATFNAATNAWNVDPAAGWNQPPSATPAAPTRTPGAAPALGELAAAEEQRRSGQASPAPDQPPTREQQWLDWLMGRSGGTSTPAFAEGGAQPPMPNSTMGAPLPLPDAIVGEGLETATPQFDTPERSELTLEPMPALGPDIFRVKVAEGATGVQADGGMLVLPLSEPAAVIAREHLRPAEGLKGEMNGDTFEAGPLSLPTAPGPVAAPGGSASAPPTPALATGGFLFDLNPPQSGNQQPQQPTFEGVPPLDPSQVQRGVLPPASLAVPSPEWAGLPGGAPPPMGNINEVSRANPAQLARYDQWLRSLGILSGIEGVQQYARRTAPTRLNLPTYAG